MNSYHHKYLRLSLIGMSGAGKSYWSAKLAEQGFKRFCCDDMIAAKLAVDLSMPEAPLMDVGAWMGFPYEAQYEAHEAQYLSCEKEVVSKVLDRVRTLDENVVIDTTGSAIYTGEVLINRLKQETLVVYLATPVEVRDKMLNGYIANKRPVIWNGLFNQTPHETRDQALARCYPRLLSSRERLYAQYGDLVIDYYTRTGATFGADEFLRLVSEREKTA